MSYSFLCPQHMGKEQVSGGGMNCCNNLLSNLKSPDPKTFTHFIDREKTVHRAQRVAWQSVTEPGIFGPALTTLLLNSTIQATRAGVRCPCSAGHD